MSCNIRVGSGFDVHKFAEGRPLYLGGVLIPHDRGLLGHSDADVVLHALTDAVLGAIGERDIGYHFSPKEARWKDASSDVFLKHAVELLREKGGCVINADLTIICEEPRINPHHGPITDRIAALLEIDRSRIALKGKTTEGLGFTGRREGIAAQAVVLVEI